MHYEGVWKKLPEILLAAVILLQGCAAQDTVSEQSSEGISEQTQCDDEACVARYLHVYDHLPSNYMTKEEARENGWTGGALHTDIEGMCIGGDRYGNYDGSLPEDDEYRECDIDTLDRSGRGSRRIVWSDDGDIWYTDDHYESWTLLYGDGD